MTISKLAFIASLLFVAQAYASDPGLEQLKQSFAGQMKSATVEFDKAASMKPSNIKTGKAITKQDCDGLATKIKANYKVDPFAFIYEGGSTYSYACGGKYGYLQNFIQNMSGTTNMGLNYTMVLQLLGHDTWGYRDELSNYFLDANYRIVEIQSLSFSAGTSNLAGYGIISVNALGNVYSEQFDSQHSLTGGGAKDVEGVHNIEEFIPTDGSAPFPMLRNRVSNKADPSKDYAIILLERADKTDWQDFQLVITHAWSGGFYNYGGKYYSNFDKPIYKSMLTIKYRGGKEYCAEGNIKADQQWTQFPADNSTYYDCVNY